MESHNRILIFHRIFDPDQTILLDQHWEMFDPILSCANQELLPSFFLNQTNEINMKFKVQESSFPVCINLQVFHFLEEVIWCAKHYSTLTRSEISEKESKKYVTFSNESILKVLGLDSTTFPQQNTTDLSKETLIQKFVAFSPQYQLNFVHSIQKPQNLVQTLNYPINAEWFQNPIQLVMFMFSQVIGLSYGQGITQSFLGFLVALFQSTKFNFAKFIFESMHEQMTSLHSL